MRLTLNHATARKPIISIYTISRCDTHTHTQSAQQRMKDLRLNYMLLPSSSSSSSSLLKIDFFSPFCALVHLLFGRLVLIVICTHKKKSIDKTLTPVIMRQCVEFIISCMPNVNMCGRTQSIDNNCSSSRFYKRGISYVSHKI